MYFLPLKSFVVIKTNSNFDNILKNLFDCNNRASSKERVIALALMGKVILAVLIRTRRNFLFPQKPNYCLDLL